MRLEAKAKAGFYPTPTRVVHLLLRNLRVVGTPDILDPCAGEGEALYILAQALRARVQGIELSRARAKRAVANGLRVYQGDSFTFQGHGFSLLWLNPPYDHGEGERLELTFLKHWTPALKPGGVLVYIIPESTLEDASPYLTAHYEEVSAWRFPEPEYQQFKQIVVLGVKAEEPLPPEDLEVQGSLEECERVYPVPGGGTAYLSRKSQLTEEEVLKALENSPLFHPSGQVRHVRPLLPLKEAHLALMLAGGFLDNQVVHLEGEPYLVRGEVKKVPLRFEEREGGVVREITRERFEVKVVALGLKSGTILEVS